MMSLVKTWPGMKIIDIGCGKDGRSFTDYASEDWHLTGIDLCAPDGVCHLHTNYTYIQRDATDLSCFENNQFNLCVSIGMLEHITDPTVRRQIISEIRRVAEQHLIIVPYRYCTIEPHYGFPYFPVFPYWMQLYFVRIFNLSNHREIVKQDADYINKNYYWPSNKELSEEFGGSDVKVCPVILDTVAVYSNG